MVLYLFIPIIGNELIHNKALCFSKSLEDDNQRCNAPGCLQCPLVNPEKRIVINNSNISVPSFLNCKTRNAIYLWKCKICDKTECYFGRTTQNCHLRTNGHRGCFNDEKWEKSALSMHANEVHKTNFSLKNFVISVIKEVSPQRIRREEFKHIDKYRTISLGLNRYKTT